MPATLRPKLGIVITVFGLLMQIMLVSLGCTILFGRMTEENEGIALVLWCMLATVYLGATALTLTLIARSRRSESQATRSILRHPFSRWVSSLFTFASSFIGLAVAVELIIDTGLDLHNTSDDLVGVWVMLLAWVMFNWGYARIYYSLYYRAPQPPLSFPGTDAPNIVDFAYLAFTNATTFAVSDVKVLTSRLRWSIVWHTTMAFFFNALVIVLTMNVIVSGELFA